MTTNNHTPIQTGAAANASTINNPLGSLDAAIGDRSTLNTTVKNNLVNAINEVEENKQDVMPNQSANTVYAGPTSGEAQPPAFRAMVGADLPASGIAPGTYLKVMVDSKGRVIEGQQFINNGDIAAAAGIEWSKIDKTGATAGQIGNNPAGNIEATTVQGAINELDTDKAPLNHTHEGSQIIDILAIPLDDFAQPGDNTDLNATTEHHGLFAKLCGDALKFFNGVGTWVKMASNIKINGALATPRGYLDLRGAAGVLTYYDDPAGDAVRVTIAGGGGGGASALADLTDVDVDGPTDKDILVYDGSAAKWQNKPQNTVKLDDFGVPDDNTDLNATTSRHGLLPRLSGNSSDVLRGDGTYSPIGGGGGAHVIQDEGSNLTNRPTLDFTGAGVQATDDAANNRTVVNIPAGGLANPIAVQVFS